MPFGPSSPTGKNDATPSRPAIEERGFGWPVTRCAGRRSLGLWFRIVRMRAAETSDLPQIVELARKARQRLASWSPVYFNPRVGADDAHAGRLGFVVGSDNHETNVLIDGDEIVGFWQLVHQFPHVWVDDLCVHDPETWVTAVAIVDDAIGRRPWVTCVSPSDTERYDGLVTTGLTVASTYWSRVLHPDDVMAVATPVGSVHGGVEAPAHTFGGRPFDAAVPGALVAGDDDGNYAIGSPSAEPPIYDPGGPTCVVDQLGGPNRRTAADLAIAAAASRGDAQLVVVTGGQDDIRGELAELGFAPQIDLLRHI